MPAMSLTKPWGCPAFLPFNLCIQNQKTWALQVSCHIPVFPQALMENGGMEWEEIYGTNPSRVLKTLASAAATSPSFPPSPCSPLFLHAPSNQNPERETRASQSGASPKAERHITFGQSVQLQLLVRRQWERGHHWHLVAVSSSFNRTVLLNDNLYKHRKLIYSIIDLLTCVKTPNLILKMEINSKTHHVFKGPVIFNPSYLWQTLFRVITGFFSVLQAGLAGCPQVTSTECNRRKGKVGKQSDGKSQARETKRGDPFILLCEPCPPLSFLLFSVTHPFKDP